MAALGLSPSRTYKKPSEPKAAILIFTRSFCIMKNCDLEKNNINSERFWGKVDISDKDSCWLWVAGAQNDRIK